MTPSSLKRALGISALRLVIFGVWGLRLRRNYHACFIVGYDSILVAEFISPPQKVYTFGFIVGNIAPRKCKVHQLSY